MTDEKISDETLAEIEENAMLQFKPDDIALIVEIDKAKFLGGDPAATRAYNRGRLLAEAEVRKSIRDSAKTGSGPAQKHFMQLADRNKLLPTTTGSESPQNGEGQKAVRQIDANAADLYAAIDETLAPLFPDDEELSYPDLIRKAAKSIQLSVISNQKKTGQKTAKKKTPKK